MKKPIFTSILVAAMLAAFTSLHAQSTVTRAVSVNGSYDAINLAGTQNLHFEIGPAGDPMTVIGTPDDLDNLEISIRNNTLTIGFKRGYRSASRTPVEIYAKNPTLKKAGVSGTGTIDISGRLDSGTNEFYVSGTGRVNVAAIDCNEVKASVSGTGRVNSASVRADKVTASVSGTGTVTLTGITANTVDAKSSGTGNVNVSGTTVNGNYITSGTGHVRAEELNATDVNATASGTGSVYCKVSGRFEGRASGTGKINLYGNPTHVSFSGSERKLVRK